MFLCFGQRKFTASFVSLNAPPAALDFEQHCGIGYRLEASRKNCKDDGECASIYSLHLKVQSASIHQFIHEWLHRDISQYNPPILVPSGWRYFYEYHDDAHFIVTMFAWEEKQASLGVYNANGAAG